MTASFEVVLAPSREIDVVAYEHHELADAIDAVVVEIERGRPDVVVDLRPDATPVPFAPKDLLRAIAGVARSTDVRVEIVVATASVADALRAQVGAPDGPWRRACAAARGTWTSATSLAHAPTPS